MKYLVSSVLLAVISMGVNAQEYEVRSEFMYCKLNEGKAIADAIADSKRYGAFSKSEGTKYMQAVLTPMHAGDTSEYDYIVWGTWPDGAAMYEEWGSYANNYPSYLAEKHPNAIENQTPFICVSAGGGMRMMESLISLSQMTRTTLAINELKSNNLPYLVLITDPTAGGITASYAMLGDIHIAEPGSLIAFAGKRVIQGTVKEELPEGFQKSEYVEKTGFVDLIVERKELASKIGTLLSILLKKNSDISAEQNETSEDSQSLTRAAS